MILLETLGRRWYAFGFIAVFLWAASAERGWKRALRFLAIAAVVEFIAEYASTHYGVPFGRYSYIAPTHGDELYVSNVPLFVPLSFGVAVWAGRSLAQVGLGARTTGRLILTGALTAAALDLIIDPMTLRGRSWFMGPLYLYDAGGPWFDVPWSNLAGWIAVSGIVLWIDELFETGRARVMDPVRGPTLAAIIAGFFLALALVTRHWAIFLGQALVAAALVALTGRSIRDAVAAAERDAGEGAGPP